MHNPRSEKFFQVKRRRLTRGDTSNKNSAPKRDGLMGTSKFLRRVENQALKQSSPAGSAELRNAFIKSKKLFTVDRSL
jgi:hypothetical protein